MARRCSVCTSPGRHAFEAAIERAISEGSPIRSLAAAYGVSESSARRHLRNHVHQTSTPDNSTPDISTPDASGPWVHVSILDRLAESVIRALPEHVRARVCDRIAELPEADYFRSRIEASVDPDKPRRGELQVMTRSGDEWQLTRFANPEAFNDHLRHVISEPRRASETATGTDRNGNRRTGSPLPNANR